MASTTFLFEVSCYVLSIINTAVALEAMELPTFVHPACENETICTLPPPWSDFEAVPVHRQGEDFIADEFKDQCYTKHETRQLFSVRKGLNDVWKEVALSKYFYQTITHIKCSELNSDWGCTNANNEQSTCGEVLGEVEVQVYSDARNGDLEKFTLPVTVGCVCKL